MAQTIRNVVVAAALLLVAGGPVLAVETEVRTFTVCIDGKPAGSYKLAYRVDETGAETIAAVSDVKGKVGVLNYTHTHRSVEVWKNGRVVSLDGSANDDGKLKTVKAVVSTSGLLVMASGKTFQSRADVLTSTGWRFPGAVDRPRDVVILDTEDGTETVARLEPLPAAAVGAAAAPGDTRRFRVTGKNLEMVWWFDKVGRPVRQETVWGGHKVVLDLISTTR